MDKIPGDIWIKHQVIHMESEVNWNRLAERMADIIAFGDEEESTEKPCRFCGEVECYCPEYEVERDKYGM